MRCRDVAANQVELSRYRTKYNELQRHTTAYNTELLAMLNDAVRIQTEDMQRMHNAWQRIGTT